MPITRRRHRSQQAFATILILMLLFMMLMLAITYLRVMRAYSLTHAQLAPASDQVLTQLELDIGTIIGADGKIGPVTTPPYYDPPTFAARTWLQTDSIVHEPYDYPWTNPNRFVNDCRLAYPQVLTSKLGMGDPMTDDSWLAPCEPEAGAWTQVSNIFGSFLVYSDASLSGTPRNAATREFVPTDAPAGAAIANLAQGQFVNFQNLPTTDPRLVDTDGDGVGDALWFYPKNNLVGGLRYVAAVRVVDTSGMVNLNTALGEAALAAPAAGYAKKGEGPYEIDPTTPAARGGLGFSSITVNGNASEKFRFPLYNGAPAMPLTGSASSYGFWMKSGAQAAANGKSADPPTRYTLEDEMQLRDFSDKSARNLGSRLFDIPAAGSLPFVAGHYGAMPSVAIRQKLTTISGAQDRFAPPPFSGSGAWGTNASNLYTGWTHRAGDLDTFQVDTAGAKRPLTFDGNFDGWKWFDASAAFSGMQELLQGVDSTTTNDDYPFPNGFATLVPTPKDRPGQFQSQMAEAVADALGRDNMPSLSGTAASPGSWMGWKPLPILTEFYGQMPYYICGPATTGGSYAPYPEADGTYDVGYINTTKDRTTTDAGAEFGQTTRAAGIGSYALELANPYSIPIRLSNVRFQFRDGAYAPFDIASANATSLSLDAYIAAAPPAGMAKDAEGFWVLKPGERIVFYRNGTGASPASTSPSTGASSDISGLISGGGGIYAVNLGTATSGATAAPDINGHYSSSNQEHVELQVMCRFNDGGPATGNYAWIPYGRMTYPALQSGSPGKSTLFEDGVPAAQKGAPGDLVYKQVDVRTFGVDQKLNLLQARPPAIRNTASDFPVDLGDCEIRTNTSGAVGSGVLPNGSAKPYPLLGSTTVTWSPGHHNIASTMPVSANWLKYDTTLSTLGQAIKVAFPGPGGTGSSPALYAQPRQDIKNGELFWNYVGLPSDSNYPGTFPELMANITGRDNANANGNCAGPERRGGAPHAMDLRKVLLAGPIYSNLNPGVFQIGNSAYRGGSGWNTYTAKPDADHLVAYFTQNTIGDAINFYLAKDTANLGVKGLCLRSDVPFYDQAKIAGPLLANKSLPQLYSDLAAKQVQLNALPGPPAPPASDPNAATRAQYAADLATINAGIRGQMNWTLSWADVICQHFQVDSPKYKGKTVNNGDDFKPGTININTASKEALSCLSLPSVCTSVSADGRPLPVGSLSNASGFTAGNFVNGILSARKNPANGAGGGAGNNGRLGLAMTSELMAQGAATFGLSGANANGDLFTTVSWLPQQAVCRSDVFCAYILLEGYKQDDFNAGPVDVLRAIVFYKRDTSGNAAKVLQAYKIPNQ